MLKLAQPFVRLQGICVQRRPCLNMQPDFRLKRVLLAIRYDLGADLTAALQNPHNHRFIFAASPVILRSLTSLCMLRALPPMKVSSASTWPDSLSSAGPMP